MAGSSSGMRKAQRTRLAKYGEGRVDPAIRAARRTGAYEKKTVAILDKPFRLYLLTPDILAHWKREYRETEHRADRAVGMLIRAGQQRKRKESEIYSAQLKALTRHARQYRRAIETGTKYLENSRVRR